MPRPSGLVVAAATPKGAVVLADDDWSGISENAFGPAQFEKGGGRRRWSLQSRARRATSPSRLAVLLGKTRIEAHARDAARINGDGRLPLVIALAATMAAPS